MHEHILCERQRFITKTHDFYSHHYNVKLLLSIEYNYSELTTQCYWLIRGKQCRRTKNYENSRVIKMYSNASQKLSLMAAFCWTINYWKAKLRDPPLEKWWGVGNFQLAGMFFWAHCLFRIFFFAGETLCMISFLNTKYLSVIYKLKRTIVVLVRWTC